jgi:hypothetical protein
MPRCNAAHLATNKVEKKKKKTAHSPKIGVANTAHSPKGMVHTAHPPNKGDGAYSPHPNKGSGAYSPHPTKGTGAYKPYPAKEDAGYAAEMEEGSTSEHSTSKNEEKKASGRAPHARNQTSIYDRWSNDNNNARQENTSRMVLEHGGWYENNNTLVHFLHHCPKGAEVMKDTETYNNLTNNDKESWKNLNEDNISELCAHPKDREHLLTLALDTLEHCLLFKSDIINLTS